MKILRGTGNGRDSGGRLIPTPPAFERAAPEPAPWLTGPARALWDRLVPDLADLDLLKPGDGPAFECLCSTYADLVEADAILKREGLVAINPQSGHIAAHPMVAVRAAARRDIRALAREFGLTPSAEGDLSAPRMPDSEDVRRAEQLRHVTPVEHDVALAAQLIAATSAGDVVRTIRVLDQACDDGRIRELCLATAGQAVGLAGEYFDTDRQQMLDERAMSLMPSD